MSAERILFRARDLILQRPVSLRVNLFSSDALRRWFVKEAEALARLDHPAIRHIYEAGVTNDIAYRIGNWVDGESLRMRSAGPEAGFRRHVLARDLLGRSSMPPSRASSCAHRAASLLLGLNGRGTVTDLRFCNLTLPEIPDGELPTGMPFLAPEVRGGAAGDPTSDIYTTGAILYYAVTATRPPLDPAEIVAPRRIRPVIPMALERVIQRALHPDPDAAISRQLNAGGFRQ